MPAIGLGTSNGPSILGLSVVLSLVAGGAVFELTRLLVPVLQRRDIVDQPGERRSHDRPTPRGGGITVVLVLFVGWCSVIAWQDVSPIRLPMFVLSFLLLTSVSGLDDIRDVSPLLRLATQVGAVLLALSAIDGGSLVFQGVLPFWLDRIATAVVWIWLINIFNFMDGIDGISVVETISIGVGVIVVSLLSDGSVWISYLAAVLAGAMAGFLPFNWYPARVFLGDVGAVPIGFVSGWLLIGLAISGQWAAAMILPLYYVADATVTLVRRVLRGEKPWEAHREHFYQQATPLGASHATTALRVLAADCVLAGLAVASIWIWAPVALAAAVAVVASFLSFIKASSES